MFKAAGTEQPHTETTNKNLVALPSQSLPPLYIKCVTPNPTTAISSVTQRFQLCISLCGTDCWFISTVPLTHRHTNHVSCLQCGTDCWFISTVPLTHRHTNHVSCLQCGTDCWFISTVPLTHRHINHVSCLQSIFHANQWQANNQGRK